MNISSIADLCTVQGLQPIKPPDMQTYKQMRCDWYNAGNGKLDGVNCPVCKNKGNIARLNDEGIEVLAECSCMAKRRNLWAMKASGLGELLDKSSFEQYEVKEDWQDRARKAAVYFTNSDRVAWFFIAGQSGSGKTMLCTAICKKLIEKEKSVKYLLWKDINHKLEAYRYEDEKYDKYITEIRNAEVLYIDDFLKTDDKDGKPLRPSSAELRNANTIINTRYLTNKITILSSEHFITELSEYDSATAGRIKEKCGNFTLSIKRDESRNYRTKGGKRNG